MTPDTSHMDQSSALDNATYQLVDRHTGKVLAEVPGTKRRALRRRADRLDLKYGAHRYLVWMVYKAPVGDEWTKP